MNANGGVYEGERHPHHLDGDALHDIERPPAKQSDLADALGLHQRRRWRLYHMTQLHFSRCIDLNFCCRLKLASQEFVVNQSMPDL